MHYPLRQQWTVNFLPQCQKIEVLTEVLKIPSLLGCYMMSVNSYHLCGLLDPEDGCSTLIQKLGNYLPVSYHITSHKTWIMPLPLHLWYELDPIRYFWAFSKFCFMCDIHIVFKYFSNPFFVDFSCNIMLIMACTLVKADSDSITITCMLEDEHITYFEFCKGKWVYIKICS